MKQGLIAIACVGALLTACGGDSEDNEAFCKAIEENLKPFEVGAEIDLAAYQTLIDEAPSGLKDDFTVRRELAEKVKELDLTELEGSQEMLRLLGQPDVSEAEKNIMAFMTSECGVEFTDLEKSGG